MQVKMSVAKKQNIDDEGRIFNNNWSNEYFVQHNQGAVCVICQTMIAVMKEYNITIYNETFYTIWYSGRSSSSGQTGTDDQVN